MAVRNLVTQLSLRRLLRFAHSAATRKASSKLRRKITKIKWKPNYYNVRLPFILILNYLFSVHDKASFYVINSLILIH